ncbi:MAG TPA: TIGR02281 family clan AA aspartic protease [Burkholderiales bacterium]|nr:TIGR02281 family clan AA aspartic protease [Burkholderiales bacterium]
MPTILAGLVLFLAHAFAAAADINVIALTAGKAVVTINNGKPLTMATGQVTPEGVRMIGATTESATFEINGKRQTLTMGQSISIGGGPVSAQRATLIADTGGHFVTVVAVNGVSMRFMVDTGASLVTLSSGDAKRAGINYLSGQKAVLQTANGTTAAFRVKLDTVRLGDITLNDVDGVVVEGNVMGELGLLGLSFLNRLNMRREGSTMTLTRRF